MPLNVPSARTNALRASSGQTNIISMVLSAEQRPAQLRHLALLNAANHILNGDAQDAVVALHGDCLDLDDNTEPLLERTLNQELRGTDNFVAGGHEHQLEQATTKAGAIDPLARAGEQHLFDQVTDV